MCSAYKPGHNRPTLCPPVRHVAIPGTWKDIQDDLNEINDSRDRSKVIKMKSLHCVT